METSHQKKSENRKPVISLREEWVEIVPERLNEQLCVDIAKHCLQQITSWVQINYFSSP